VYNLFTQCFDLARESPGQLGADGTIYRLQGGSIFSPKYPRPEPCKSIGADSHFLRHPLKLMLTCEVANTKTNMTDFTIVASHHNELRVLTVVHPVRS
jgi:hypothetical protein